jgi:peroxiredoxin
MKKISQIVFAVIILVFLGCSQQNENEFVLKGSMNNFNGFIEISGIPEVDSIQVIDGQFELKGIIEEPKDIYLINKGDFKVVWIQKGVETNITTTADGKLANAMIKGSAIQEYADKFVKSRKVFFQKRDSLIKFVRDTTNDADAIAKAKASYNSYYGYRWMVAKEFVQNNTNNYYSINLLDGYKNYFSKAFIKDQYSLFSEELKSTSHGKNIQRYLDLKRDLTIGDSYVDFSMKDTNDKDVRLSDFQGKIILLDFWNTNCGPCIEEFPTLKNAYQTFKNKGFEIVSVSDDKSEERWSKMIQNKELNWVNLRNKSELDSEPHLIYDINGIPDNFLINQEGVIVARNLRGEKLVEKLQELTK